MLYRIKLTLYLNQKHGISCASIPTNKFKSKTSSIAQLATTVVDSKTINIIYIPCIAIKITPPLTTSTTTSINNTHPLKNIASNTVNNASINPQPKTIQSNIPHLITLVGIKIGPDTILADSYAKWFPESEYDNCFPLLPFSAKPPYFLSLFDNLKGWKELI